MSITKAVIKLYINRVFITDDEKELMPTYLRFLRGVIDSADLPLNVSREILQSNRVMAKIKNASVKKVLGELSKVSENDTEKYDAFYKEFGNVLKEGLYSDMGNREKILELLKLNTLNSAEPVMFSKFVEGVDAEKKEIYYITAKMSLQMLKNSPSSRAFQSKRDRCPRTQRRDRHDRVPNGKRVQRVQIYQRHRCETRRDRRREKRARRESQRARYALSDSSKAHWVRVYPKSKRPLISPTLPYV